MKLLNRRVLYIHHTRHESQHQRAAQQQVQRRDREETTTSKNCSTTMSDQQKNEPPIITSINDVKFQIDEIEKTINQTTDENRVKKLIKDIRNLNETMENQIQNFIKRVKQFTIMFLKGKDVVSTQHAIQGQVFLGLLEECIVLTLEPSDDETQILMKIKQQDGDLK